MATGRAIALAGITLAGALSARPAAAYDAHVTHRWLTRKAIEHLRALYPGRYDVVLPFLEEVVEGASQEDLDLVDGDGELSTTRGQRHFLHPHDGVGLTVDGRAFPSAAEWGLVPSAANAYGYDDALALAAAGDVPGAYRAIGHVLHLVQDLTVPAHSHLEPHGLVALASDVYEDHCAAALRSEYDGDLRAPPFGVTLPELEDLDDLFVATAWAGYYRAVVPGALSPPADGQAGGALAAMFPALAVDWLSGEWQIPEVGALGAAFVEREPGLFYFRVDAHGATERVDFSPSAPREMVFEPALGRSLVEGMADDLVPLAVLSSAAVLKRFLDESGRPGSDARDDGARPDRPDADDPGTTSSGCAAGGRTPGLLAVLALAMLRPSRPRRRPR